MAGDGEANSSVVTAARSGGTAHRCWHPSGHVLQRPLAVGALRRRLRYLHQSSRWAADLVVVVGGSCPPHLRRILRTTPPSSPRWFYDGDGRSSYLRRLLFPAADGAVVFAAAFARYSSPPLQGMPLLLQHPQRRRLGSTTPPCSRLPPPQGCDWLHSWKSDLQSALRW